MIASMRPEERLFFRLTEGEERIGISRGEAAIAAALARAGKTARGLLILVHGAASNASRWEEFVEKRGSGTTGIFCASTSGGMGRVPRVLPERSKRMPATLRLSWISSDAGAR